MRSDRLTDQLEQIEIDLVELDGQVEAGEIDETTAAELRNAYRNERARLAASVDALGETPPGRSRAA